MSYGLGEGEEEKKSHEDNGGGLWHLKCVVVDLLLGMKMKRKGGGIYIEDLVGVKGSAIGLKNELLARYLNILNYLFLLDWSESWDTLSLDVSIPLH